MGYGRGVSSFGFVEMTAAVIRDPGVLAPGATGVRPAMRQICHLLLLAIIFGGFIVNHAISTVAAVAPIVAVLLLWCLASALWVTEPSVLHNFKETDFPESDAPAWASCLLMFGVLRHTWKWNPARTR